MAHTIGMATGPTDLLEQLRVWLLNLGWTLDLWAVDGNGYRLHLHKGSTYLNFRSYASEWPTYYIAQGPATTRYGIAFNMGTGFNGAAAWHSQPGVPLWEGTPDTMGAATVLGPGPYTSHQFFDDGQGNYLIMVERSPGVWRNLCWGDSLDKSGAGTWTGGAYFSGTTSFGFLDGASDNSLAWPNFPPVRNGTGNGGYSYVRADIDTFTGKWLTLATDQYATFGGTTGKHACNAMICDWGCAWTEPPVFEAVSLTSRLYCQQDERAILLPMAIYAKRDAGGMSFLGTAPSIAVAATPGMIPGQDLVIGTETWRRFNGFLVRVIE